MGRKVPEKVEEKKEEEKKPDHATEEVEHPPIIKELIGYDDDYLKLERQFEAERRKLKKKYDELMDPLLEERKQMLVKDGTPAVEDFWLKAFENCPSIVRTDFGEIHDYDKPVLKHLTDVKAEDLSYEKDAGFKVSFFFSENPYFEEKVLEMTVHTEEENPYAVDGVACKKLEGTSITWKEGKDVTVEVSAKKVKGGGKKKAKQKGKETVKPRPSFFRLFRDLKEGDDLPEDMSEIMLGEDVGEIDDEDLAEMVGEFMSEIQQVAGAIAHEVVPFAVRWYTGEATPEMDDDDEDSEEESDEDDESEEEDDSPPPKKGGKGGKKKPAGGEKKEECKQQ